MIKASVSAFLFTPRAPVGSADVHGSSRAVAYVPRAFAHESRAATKRDRARRKGTVEYVQIARE